MPRGRISSPGVHSSRLDPPGDGGGPDLVTETLDPVLASLGFAPGQVGIDAQRGQVIFCRGEIGSSDGGCVDLVVEVAAAPDWRVTDVRYWGDASDRWHLDFNRDASLPDQVAGLAQSLPRSLQ